VKAQTTAVIPNDSINDGPAPGRNASPGAGRADVAKIPAPMIAPIPSKVTFKVQGFASVNASCHLTRQDVVEVLGAKYSFEQIVASELN
jgi:hypothetical protein